MLRRHDPTYYLAVSRLPRERRSAVHALYGFVRGADEIVDGAGSDLRPDERRRGPRRVAGGARARGGDRDVRPPGDRRARPRRGRPSSFPSRSSGRTWRRCGWTAGRSGSRRGRSSSATWTAAARPSAGSWRSSSARRRRASALARLGVAFQLTNFLRDLREDYLLDRIYLPADERERHGVGEERPRGRAPRAPGLRELVASEVRVARALFAETTPALLTSIPSARRGIALARAVYCAVLDRIERNGFDVLGRASRPRIVDLARVAVQLAVSRRPEQPLVDERADVVVCGASFAGLTVARELAGTGADVLVLDRDEIGAHPTSACAAPMPWLEAPRARELGASRSFRSCASRRRTARFACGFPWSWGAFDYSELCRLLWRSVGRALRARAREGPRRRRRADRSRHRRAPLVVDALGWRRVLGSQPFAATGGPLTRGLEVHPSGGGDALDVVIDRSLLRRGYCWRVPAGDEVRVGAGSYDPRVAVKQPTADDRAAFRRGHGPPPGEPHPAPAATGCGERLLLRRRLRRPLLRALGGGHSRRVLLRDRVRPRAAPRARGRSDRRRGARVVRRVQRAPSKRVLGSPTRCSASIPELPPRALTFVIRALSGQRFVDAIFNWYLGLLPLRRYSSESSRRARTSGRQRRSRLSGRCRAPSGSRSRSPLP